MDHRSDAEIIVASLAEAHEFSAIYERYFEAVYRYVARRLGAGAAGDVTAEVFVRAFELRRRYDKTRESCRPWLYGIASNVVRDQLRQQRRRQRAYVRAMETEASTGAIEAAEDRAAAALMVPRINAALGKLSEGDRETLLLHALADLTYEEIAIALGVPIGTVRSRLSRAREKMRELLSADRQTMGRGENE